MPARNVVSGGISNSGVKYSRLATDDDGYTDLQVRPWVHDWSVMGQVKRGKHPQLVRHRHDNEMLLLILRSNNCPI